MTTSGTPGPLDVVDRVLAVRLDALRSGWDPDADWRLGDPGSRLRALASCDEAGGVRSILALLKQYDSNPPGVFDAPTPEGTQHG